RPRGEDAPAVLGLEGLDGQAPRSVDDELAALDLDEARRLAEQLDGDALRVEVLPAEEAKPRSPLGAPVVEAPPALDVHAAIERALRAPRRGGVRRVCCVCRVRRFR